MVAEVLAEEEVSVFLVVEAAQLEVVGLCAALHGDVLRLALLVRHNRRNGGLAKLQLALHTKQLLGAGDKGAVERETDVTSLKELDDFVFLALVFQVELVLVVEGRLGVLVDVEVDLVADFGNHVHLDIHIHDEIVVAFPLFAARGVVAVGVLEAESQVDGALWTDVDGIAAEDGLEALAADEHGRDDRVAIGGGAGILASAFLPVFLYALAVLVLKIFVLGQCGGRVVIEIADAPFESVLARQRVVDDFGLVVRRVVEVERRLVVEVLNGVASVDRDGVNDFRCVGFYDVGAMVENIVAFCCCQAESGE